MKRISGLFVSILLAIPALAQEAHVASIKFHGQDRPGVEANYPYGASVTEEILMQHLKDAGLKRDKHDKGFTVYQEVEWPDILAGKVDVYVRVGGTKNTALVQLMITRGYDNFITPATDGPAFTNIQNFLNSLGPVIGAALHDADVREQQQAVKEAEKDLHRSERDAKKAGRKERDKEKEKARMDKEKDQKAKDLAEEQKKLEEIKQK